jgi:hypothetical protein
MGKLDNASQRFNAAINGRVLYLGLDWPALERYISALHQYYNETAKVALPAAADVEVAELFTIQRKLLTLPIDPNHPSVGATAFLASTPVSLSSSSLTVNRDAVIDALRSLVDEPHVAKELLALVTEKFRSVIVEGKSVACLVPRGYKDLAHDVLKMEEAKSNEFLTLSELRRSEMKDLVFVFGSPEHHLWHRDPVENRQAKVSWLYSAPAADTTITVSWTGHPKFDLAHYSVWSEWPLTATEIVGSVAFKATATVAVSPVPRDALVADIDGVDATLVDLVGGGSIAFHPEFGPKPQVLEVEELEFDIRSVHVRSLEPRHVIIFRTDDSEISFIRKTARASMGKKRYDNALAVSNAFKTNVISASQTADVTSALNNNGIVNAEYYLNVVTDERYIGPKDFQTAQKIAVALGFNILEDDFQILNDLRSHHRTAGLKANEIVRASLAESHEWEDAIGSGVQAHIDLGEAGTVVIAVVEAIGQIKRKVSRLGVAENLPHSEEHVMSIGFSK